MATSATILNLQQLTDAALIGPDFGTVHFRLLHTTLQIIISQLGLQDLMVEFTGPESEMIQKIFDPKIPGGFRSTHYNISGNVHGDVNYPGGYPGTQPGYYPGAQPGTHPGTQPGTHPGSQPGTYPASQPGTQPGSQPGSYAGNYPDAGTQPGDMYKQVSDSKPSGPSDTSRSQDLDTPKSNYDSPTPTHDAPKPYNVPKTPSYDMRKQPHDASKSGGGGGGYDPSRPSYGQTGPNVPKSQPMGKVDGGNVIIVPRNEDREITSAFTVAVTTEEFERLTRDVHDLKIKYNELTKMSSNTDLMKAIRTSTGNATSPVVDMYQILSLTKRIEAAELGMSKLASMIEDLAKEQVDAQKGAPPSGGQTVTKVIEKATKLRSSIDNGQGPFSEQLKEIEQRLTLVEQKCGEKIIADSGGTHLPKIVSIDGPVTGDDFLKVDLTNKEMGEALVLIQAEFKNVRNLIQALDVPGLQRKIDSFKFGGGGTSDKDAPIVVGGGGDISERMGQMEMHFNQCLDHINSLDKMFHGKMETVANQISSLERELGSLTDKMLGIDDHVSTTGATEVNVLDLYKKFMELENVTNNIGQTAAELLDEREQRSLHMSSILEQIEELKTMKADKQDVEGQLADKVDICMINKKVSHEQFDATCMDLTRGIEDALEKLTRQEELWQQALMDIQTEVGSKLDKMEIGPLKDFITHKLGVLQAKLKALARFKKEQEAAGTKAALLKDVKCISCDQDVVMRKTMDPSLYPQPPSLPPTKTMAPYLAYELDQLRKQQRTLNTSRNLNHFEQIKKGDACNRYCGGSHTLTTPQQRVTRLGHFLEQWGPEISLANDTEIKGKDGMVYKGEEKADVSILQAPSTPITAKRPSMVVQGDILGNRPDQAERLSISKQGKGPGGVSFN